MRDVLFLLNESVGGRADAGDMRRVRSGGGRGGVGHISAGRHDFRLPGSDSGQMASSGRGEIPTIPAGRVGGGKEVGMV